MGTGVIAPPPPPPDSGGGIPTAGMGVALQRRVGQPSPGGQDAGMATHPQGALMAQAQAVSKVIDQMSDMNPAFKPFGERAKTTIQAGVSAAMGADSTTPPPANGAPGGAGPGAGGPGGPGGGAPPFPG